MQRRKRGDVSVERVYDGDVYARVSTVGTEGDRAFVLVPGIGVSANDFERLAFQLNEFGPVIALDRPGFGGIPPSAASAADHRRLRPDPHRRRRDHRAEKDHPRRGGESAAQDEH